MTRPFTAYHKVDLDHTLAFRNLLCKVHVAPKLNVCLYLAIWWPWPLTLEPQIFRYAQHCSNKCFALTKLLPGTLNWRDGSETRFLPVLGHLMIVTFDFQIFRNAQHCPSFNWQKCHLVHFIELWNQKCNFAYIWSCGELGLWHLDLKFFRNSQHCPSKSLDWQKFLSSTFEWSCGCKTVVLTILGHVMTIPFDLWTSDFQKCLTRPQ